MTAYDLPPFPEIPLTPEQRLRWAAWGKECMARERERCARICNERADQIRAMPEASAPHSGVLMLAAAMVPDECAAAIRASIGNNESGQQE